MKEQASHYEAVIKCHYQSTIKLTDVGLIQHLVSYLSEIPKTIHIPIIGNGTHTGELFTISN